jgi:sphingomyelin phosphodiesterase
MHIAAITQPLQTITDLLIRACEQFKLSIYAATCEEEYSGIGGTGPYLAQLFAQMSQATGDMQAFCYYNYYVCDEPPVIQINESEWFGPKPSGLVAPPSSGETINVLHLTDWHLDPRYDIGSEANCSEYLCCRPYSTNTALNTDYTNASFPASRFGYLYCDTPADLGVSLFTEMPNFINVSDITFTIFTGDIVTHDNDDQLSQAYVEFEEEICYNTFKAHLGTIVSPPF